MMVMRFNDKIMIKMVEFMRNYDDYDVVVVLNACLGDVRRVCLDDEWIEVPFNVAEPLGALIDLFNDVEYDLGVTVYKQPIKDRVFRFVEHDYIPVLRGVMLGFYTVFVRRTKRFMIDGATRSNYYFNEVVDGFRQKTKRDLYLFSLHLGTDNYTSGFSIKQQIRYKEIINKYWRDRDFAVNSYEVVGKGDKRAKYTSNKGNTCYMSIDFVKGEIEANLKLYLYPNNINTN